MFITQNKETMDYFHRFNKIMINSEPWEVQGVDSISTPGILEVHLKETYNNIVENDIDKAVKDSINIDIVDYDKIHVIDSKSVSCGSQILVEEGLKMVAQGFDTFEIVESEKWIAEATDVTALLGTDDLIKHQNKVVSFKAMTIEKVEFKNNQAGPKIVCL